jgi:histone H4
MNIDFFLCCFNLNIKMPRNNTVRGITNPAIKRLCRRGGVKRIANPVYDETRELLKKWLEDVIRDAITYTEHARRRTVTPLDIAHALKLRNRPIYG